MGCATGVVKFFMFLFNFIFVVAGIGMVVLGTMVIYGFDDYKNVVGELDQYKAPPIVLIVVGSIIFFVAFMGCCGVLRENNCMMMTFAVFLTIALLMQVGIAVGAAVYEDDFKGIVVTGMKKSVSKYESHAEVKSTWDSLQSNLKCCGAENYMDWKNATVVPESCCKDREPGCSRNALVDPSPIYTTGCVEKVLSNFKLKYVMITAAVIAGIELLGIMFSCCLAARFRRKNYA